MTDLSEMLDAVKRKFEERSGLSGMRYEVVRKPDADILVLFVAAPSERLYEVLETVRDEVERDCGQRPFATLKVGAEKNLIEAPEGRLLLRVLSEIQNVNRYTFQDDFSARYVRSVSGAEEQIVSAANHLVTGRRGAGKSMLLLFSWQQRRALTMPSVWIDMQAYSRRNDTGLIVDLWREILDQVSKILGDQDGYRDIVERLQGCGGSLQKIQRIHPEIRRLLARFAASGRDLFIFLDDFHALELDIQPSVLDALYSVARGNRIFLKISAIEGFVRTYDRQNRMGLEVPQDAQTISLDYNLTTPDKATKHIEAILDGHARYSGIRSIRRLCTSQDVVSRLTWVVAGVPRDALNLFSQAMTAASVEGRHRVSVSNVNVSASKTLGIKLKDMETDASEHAHELHMLMERIRKFCIEDKRKNAFLVSIGSNEERLIMDLVSLRLLHVISEGITVGKAGRKYLGLILDYGFYTGIRAAQSVDLFNRQSQKVAYKELRGLPVFTG